MCPSHRQVRSSFAPPPSLDNKTRMTWLKFINMFFKNLMTEPSGPVCTTDDRLTTEIRHIFDFVTALGIYLRKEGNVCLNWFELKKLSQWRRENRRWSSRIVLHFSLYFSGIDPTDVSFFLLLILDLQRRQPQSRERYVQDCTQALRLVYSTE